MKRMTQKTPAGVVLHPPYTIAQALARLAAFEDMQGALAAQRESVEKNLAEMRAAGKEKTATFHQLLARRLTLIQELDRIHIYTGLDGEP